MATKVTPVQLLRSAVLKKRPDPALLLAGQPGVNTNPDEPGLFFADSTGAELFKIGPCGVGTSAPNSGATGNPGQLGNTKGEMWLDTSGPTAVLKIWDGSSWQDCFTPVTQVAALKSLEIQGGFDGVAKTFTLLEAGTTTPFQPNPPENVAVFVGGASQLPAKYSVSGNQITFVDVIPLGTEFNAFSAVLV